MVPSVGQLISPALASQTVLTTAGEPVALQTCWAERDALLIFVRHFACAGCSEHITELSPRLAEFDALGVQVALVGCGSPAELRGFIERHALGDKRLRTFTDPTLAAYRAAGLMLSRWGTIGPLALWQLLRALGRGHRNGRRQGDLHQQGGTLFVTRGGLLASYHRAHSLGDHVPVVELVDLALRRRATEVTGPC